jgi:hypothetical protein
VREEKKRGEVVDSREEKRERKRKERKWVGSVAKIQLIGDGDPYRWVLYLTPSLDLQKRIDDRSR